MIKVVCYKLPFNVLVRQHPCLPPGGEGAPKGRMRGSHHNVEQILLMQGCSPHQSKINFIDF